MKTIQEIKGDFEQVLSEVIKINGVSIEAAIQTAVVILQEAGKDRRAETYRQQRLNINGNGNNNNHANGGKAPATDNQKNAMDNFGIEYSEDITKAEASALLEKAIAEAESKRNNRNKKGGLATAPS
jgi:hypothetical protein